MSKTPTDPLVLRSKRQRLSVSFWTSISSLFSLYSKLNLPSADARFPRRFMVRANGGRCNFSRRRPNGTEYERPARVSIRLHGLRASYHCIHLPRGLSKPVGRATSSHRRAIR